MISDSKSPFSAASGNGSTQSPFQSASSSSKPKTTAIPDSKPQQLKAVADKPSSPFALVEDAAKSGGGVKERPSIVEPSEGFAASEAPAKPTQKASSAPVAMPSGRDDRAASVMNNGNSNGSNGDRNDPFADPSVAASSGKRSSFVLPSEASNPAAAVAPAPVAQSKPVPAQAAAPSVTGDTSQLILRAIFGVSRDLNREEIVQRARTLPGVRNLQLVSPADIGAFAAFRSSIERMGFGEQSAIAITTNGGVVDFVEEPGASLAVLHEGTYAAGVRETLILVAREIARLV